MPQATAPLKTSWRSGTPKSPVPGWLAVAESPPPTGGYAFGDCCMVDLFVGGQIQRVAVAHVVPEKEALMREIQRRYPITLDAPNSLTTDSARGDTR